MIRLYRDSQSSGLAELLRQQQEDGEMTDVTLVCAGGESLPAHRLVLSTHPVWARILLRTRTIHTEEKLVLIMEFSSQEVRRWLDEAYQNIIDLGNSGDDDKDAQMTVVDVAPDIKDYSSDDCDDFKKDESDHLDFKIEVENYRNF